MAGLLPFLRASDIPVGVLDATYDRRVRETQRRHGPGSAAEHRVIRAYTAIHAAAIEAATPSSEDDLDVAVAIANGVAS